MPAQYSISIITYAKRFKPYFIPLIRDIISFFPDIEVICIANGHPDKNFQFPFLKDFAAFLAQFPNIRYYTFEDNQSLGKLWNLSLIYSSAAGSLILNDDIRIGPGFRKSFEDHLSDHTGFFMINNSFSHFYLSKSTVKKTGWFDERFPGIGHEDGDFLIRCASAGISIETMQSPAIYNFTAPADDPTWAAISARTDEKYSQANKDFFNKKWHSSWYDPDLKDWDVEFGWKDETVRAKLCEGMETPVFYDYGLLDGKPGTSDSILSEAAIQGSAGIRLLPLWLKSQAKKLLGKS